MAKRFTRFTLGGKDMTEKQIERSLCKAVKAAGGFCPKWVSPGFDGVPDRIALFGDGRVGFIEVKRPGGKPRKIQLLRHKELRALGFQVFVLDDPSDIPGIIERIRNG